MAERLRPYVKGTLSMFSGETNVDLGGRLVILNVEALRQAGGQELQTVAYMMIGEHIRQRLMATRRRKLVGIDEAHILFARRDTAEFVSGLSRTAAKVGGRTMLITQSITDLIGDPKTGIRAAGEQPARVYLGQVGTTVLLRNDKSDDVELIAGLFGLSDAEAEGILSAERGEGLLIAGDERVQVLVMAPDVLHPLIVTDFVPDEAPEEE